MQQIIDINIEKYRENIKDNEIDEKLLKAEKQIKDGKTVKATDVFRELEEKYGF